MRKRFTGLRVPADGDETRVASILVIDGRIAEIAAPESVPAEADEEIVELNIPTGIPLVYELEDDLRPIKRYYLGDPEKIAKATHAVASQLEKN